MDTEPRIALFTEATILLKELFDRGIVYLGDARLMSYEGGRVAGSVCDGTCSGGHGRGIFGAWDVILGIVSVVCIFDGQLGC